MFDEMMKMKPQFGSDDILAALGLQRRQTGFESAMPTALAFFAGIAAGAGIALLMAPKSGREMRTDLSNKASELTQRIGSAARDAAENARSAIGSDNDHARSEAQRPQIGSNRSTS